MKVGHLIPDLKQYLVWVIDERRFGVVSNLWSAKRVRFGCSSCCKSTYSIACVHIGSIERSAAPSESQWISLDINSGGSYTAASCLENKAIMHTK